MIDMRRHFSRRAKKFSRREFLKSSAAGTLIAPAVFSKVWANINSRYQGKCLVTLQLDGGADVTQLCDPKINITGERKINNWADWDEPRQAGNIFYAPIADNERLFQKYGSDMLVINGVDAQTNSHETGRLFNWTGSNAEGKPSVSALHAAYQSPDQPLAYAVFGGTSRTSRLIGYNRFDNLGSLRTLCEPRFHFNSNQQKRGSEEFNRIDRLVDNEVQRLLSNPSATARQIQNLRNFEAARENSASLKSLAKILPPSEEIMPHWSMTVESQELWSSIKEQMQGALLIFKSGLGSAADVMISGFDSHDNHDAIHEQLYLHLSDALDFFWDYAEELEIADRILLVIGTDFGRTNFYNDGAGKDHWPIGSYIIMARNAHWGNRVVGLTDELHFAKRMNPVNLTEDPNGIFITPAHVHKAIQKYLNLDQYAQANGVELKSIESLPLFDPEPLSSNKPISFFQRNLR